MELTNDRDNTFLIYSKILNKKATVRYAFLLLGHSTCLRLVAVS